MFVQIACESNTSQLDSKNSWGLATACVGLLMVAIFYFALRKIFAESKIEAKLVSYEENSIQDYTVEGEITEKLFQLFQLQNRDNQSIQAFKEALKAKIEELLETEAKLPASLSQIVDIRFSFCNKQILSKLESRAKALKKKRFDKVRTRELELDKTKNEQFAEMRRPQLFYVTFENVIAAQSFLKMKEFLWLDRTSVKLRRPLDPSDFAWTNRGLRSRRRCCRASILLMLALSGNIAVILSQFMTNIDWQQYYSYLKQPPGINCDTVRQQFGSNLDQMAYVEFQYDLLSRFPNEGNYVFLNERVTRTGAYHCLCEESQSIGKSFDISLPDGSVTQIVLCPNRHKFLGFFSTATVKS